MALVLFLITMEHVADRAYHLAATRQRVIDGRRRLGS